MAQIEITGLRKAYNGAVAIDGVDLNVATGSFVTLLGPSGCGKTTTLRCLAGFITPDAGAIRVDGRDIIDLGPEGRDFGVVFQNYALFPHLSVFDNVAYGLQARRVASAEIRTRVEEVLGLVQLGHLKDRLPRALSGGQQQRVALARALVIRPQALLLDEPLANLDAKLRFEMRWLIRELQRKAGITALYVTHDQAEAMALSDQVAVMKQGRIAQLGSPRDIYQRPRERYVAEFTGEASYLNVQLVTALGPGRYRVATAAGEVEVQGPPGLPPGGRHVLLLRPEALQPGPAGLRATLLGRFFVGSAQHCEMRVGDEIIKLYLPPQAEVAEGAEVTLAVDPAAAWLLPDEAAP
jgi:ABC-type Fe3+/spermidine/putrescine transport system ATPase subunit